MRRPGADEPGRPRLHQTADAERTPSSVASHGAAPRQLLRRQRLHPALLILELMSKKGQSLRDRSAAAQRYFIRADQHPRAVDGRRARQDRGPPGNSSPSTSSAASPSGSTTGTSTSAPEHRAAALNLRGLTRIWAAPRRVLAIIGVTPVASSSRRGRAPGAAAPPARERDQLGGTVALATAMTMTRCRRASHRRRVGGRGIDLSDLPAGGLVCPGSDRRRGPPVSAGLSPAGWRGHSARCADVTPASAGCGSSGVSPFGIIHFLSPLLRS